MRFLALAILMVPAVSALGASVAAARDMGGHDAAMEHAAPAFPIARGEHGSSDGRVSDRGFSHRRFSDRRDRDRRFCPDCVLPFYDGLYDYGYWNGDDGYGNNVYEPPPPDSPAPPPPPPVYRPITVEHTPEGVDIIRGPGSAPLPPQGAQAQTPPAPANPPSPRPPGVSVLRGGVQ